MNEEFVIVLSMVILFGVPFFYAYKSRQMRHEQTMKMIEKGLVKAPEHRNGKDTLRWGIILTAVGVALMIGLYPIGFTSGSSPYPLNFGPWMLVGLLPTFFGLGMIAVYHYTQDDEEEKDSNKK